MFAATFAFGLLISPHLYLYDLMLLLLPLAIVLSHYPRGTLKRPLDGGSLLVWTALLYLVTFVGCYFSMGQLWLTGGVTAEFVTRGSYEIELADRRVRARASLSPLYDPKNLRVRC